MECYIFPDKSYTKILSITFMVISSVTPLISPQISSMLVSWASKSKKHFSFYYYLITKHVFFLAKEKHSLATALVRALSRPPLSSEVFAIEAIDFTNVALHLLKGISHLCVISNSSVSLVQWVIEFKGSHQSLDLITCSHRNIFFPSRMMASRKKCVDARCKHQNNTDHQNVPHIDFCRQ